MVKMIMMKVKKYEWQCVLADILVLAFWPFFRVRGYFFLRRGDHMMKAMRGMNDSVW